MPKTVPVKAKKIYYGNETCPGVYKISGQGVGEFFLDVDEQKVYTKANLLVANKTRLVQEEIIEKKSFIPVPIFGGKSSGLVVVSGSSRGGNERLRYRITDLEGKKIIDLWESSSFGDQVIINRKKGDTKILDYDGNILREFKSTKEGYIPLVGKYKESGEADEPLAGSMNPGAGIYQPYYNGSAWGILDRNTGLDVLAPNSKYGYIILVEPKGQKFWALYGKGEGKDRLYGIKEFELTSLGNVN